MWPAAWGIAEGGKGGGMERRERWSHGWREALHKHHIATVYLQLSGKHFI